MDEPVISFDNLPQETDAEDIIMTGGLILEQQIRQDSATDYTKKSHFNTAIWYIAEKAQRRNFHQLNGASTEQIAKAIGDTIDAYLKVEKDAKSRW